jgi:hypothetical protein
MPVLDLPASLRFSVLLNPLSYGVDGLPGALSGNFAFGIATDLAVLGNLTAILLATGAYLFSKIEVQREPNDHRPLTGFRSRTAIGASRPLPRVPAKVP